MLVNAPKRIAPDLALHRVGLVNVYFIGRPGSEWVMVDTGTPGHADEVMAAARARFGQTPPTSIVLTHGHFDHSGNAGELARRWGVPVYAHRRELPYLTGLSPYPPPDPLTGGFVGVVSVFFPRSGTEIREWVYPLPDLIPGLAGWRVIPTPGHAPGQIALFRESDRTLVAGDALATVRMETLRALLAQRPELTGGPIPFIYDWSAAIDSVQRLAALRPTVIAAGHGEPMSGPELPEQFAAFAESYRPPDRGRYVREPARVDENGIVSLPPAVRFAWLRVAWRGLAAGGGLLGAALWLLCRRRGISR